jgi:CPA2 family monovalent cation:H+ antiporter-2
VLRAANLASARALIVTVPTYAEVRAIVEAARRIRPDLVIIARADGPAAVQELYALGIQEVTSPEFEAAIEMTREALVQLKVSPHQVMQVASAIRRERYGGGDQSAYNAHDWTREVSKQLDFAWVELPSLTPTDGRTLGDLQVRSQLGASIVGVIHDGALLANPGAHTRLSAGDLIAVFGTREQIARFEEAVTPPPGVG